MQKSHTQIYVCLKPGEIHSSGSRMSTQHMKPEESSGEEADNPSTDSIIRQPPAAVTFIIQLMPNSGMVTDNIYEVIKRYSN
jgi:hypothetical protein